MKHFDKYIKQVENRLTSKALKRSAVQVKQLRDYIGTQQKVLGVNTSLQRQLAKSGYNLSLDREQQLLFFDKVFKKADVFELKNSALLFLENNFEKLDEKTLLKVIPSWVDHVDNWAHSDHLSKFYTRFIEKEKTRESFLPVLRSWNKNKNEWKRRQSMVALMYYARTRKNHLPFKILISFVEPHLNASEYYVQKGLGWTLRECYNVYPQLTYKFMIDKVETVSPVAFTAACEKMSMKQREFLKEMRKLYRVKNK